MVTQSRLAQTNQPILHFIKFTAVTTEAEVQTAAKIGSLLAKATKITTVPTTLGATITEAAAKQAAAQTV